MQHFRFICAVLTYIHTFNLAAFCHCYVCFCCHVLSLCCCLCHLFRPSALHINFDLSADILHFYKLPMNDVSLQMHGDVDVCTYVCCPKCMSGQLVEQLVFVCVCYIICCLCCCSPSLTAVAANCHRFCRLPVYSCFCYSICPSACLADGHSQLASRKQKQHTINTLCFYPVNSTAKPGRGALEAYKQARALVAALIIYEILLATGDECRFVVFAEKLHYNNGGTLKEGDPDDQRLPSLPISQLTASPCLYLPVRFSFHPKFIFNTRYNQYDSIGSLF